MCVKPLYCTNRQCNLNVVYVTEVMHCKSELFIRGGVGKEKQKQQIPHTIFVSMLNNDGENFLKVTVQKKLTCPEKEDRRVYVLKEQNGIEITKKREKTGSFNFLKGSY